MLKAKIIPWNAKFPWGGKLKTACKQSPDEILIFVYLGGKFNPDFLAAHLRFHERFPFSIGQGGFFWEFADRRFAFSPFDGIPDSAHLPLCTPFNLSIPQEVLQRIESFEEIHNASDFMVALADVCRRELVSIGYVSEAAIVYPSFHTKNISMPDSLSECKKMGKTFQEAFRSRPSQWIPAWSSDFVLRAFMKSIFQNSDHDSQHLSPFVAMAKNEFKTGFAASSQRNEVPRNESEDPESLFNLNIEWRDREKIKEDRKMFSPQHAEILQDFRITTRKSNGDNVINAAPTGGGSPPPILISYPFNAAAENRETSYRIFLAFPFLPESAKILCQKDSCDEIWVPSEFYKKILTEAGVSAPTHLIPYAIDPSIFKPNPLRLPLFTKRFSFLTMVDDPRTCSLDILLHSYWEAFQENDPVLLAIAAESFKEKNHAAISSAVACARASLKKTGAAVAILQSPSTPRELSSLYGSCDVFVSIRRDGLGGLSLLQAAACGKALIISKAGEAESMTLPDFAYFVKTNKNLEPSFESTKSILRQVFEERGKLPLKSQPAVDFARQWSLKRSARAMRQRLGNAVKKVYKPYVKMGENDSLQLGDGWHALEGPPYFRWSQGEAELFLLADGEGWLRLSVIHGRNGQIIRIETDWESHERELQVSKENLWFPISNRNGILRVCIMTSVFSPLENNKIKDPRQLGIGLQSASLHCEKSEPPGSIEQEEIHSKDPLEFRRIEAADTSDLLKEKLLQAFVSRNPFISWASTNGNVILAKFLETKQVSSLETIHWIWKRIERPCSVDLLVSLYESELAVSRRFAMERVLESVACLFKEGYAECWTQTAL